MAKAKNSDLVLLTKTSTMPQITTKSITNRVSHLFQDHLGLGARLVLALACPVNLSGLVPAD